MRVVDFFNWNKVKIRYCDGASFAGHPEAESELKVLTFELIQNFFFMEDQYNRQ